MSKVKQIKKKFNIGGGADSIFNQMTGGESKHIDNEIVASKIIDCRKVLMTMSKLLSMLGNNETLREMFPDEKNGFEQINEFTQTLITENKLDVKRFSLDNIGEIYEHIKSNKSNQDMLDLCSVLRSDYKVFIEEKDPKMFIDHVDCTFKLFPFSSLDFYKIWNAEHMTINLKAFIFDILKRLMDIGYEYYQIIVRPDFDVKEFSKNLVAAIAQLKGQIPRCEDAFKAIEDSVDMLEENFADYYKESIIANDQSVILQRYIGDIVKSKPHSPNLMRQFRQITNFQHQKMTSSGKSDPKMQQLFSVLNEKMDIAEAKNDEKKTDEKQVDEHQKQEIVELSNEEKLAMFGIKLPSQQKSKPIRRKKK